MQLQLHFAAIAITFWVQAANSVAWLALPVIAPQVALDLNMEASRIGQTSGLMFGGALLPTLLSGPLIPRFGPLRVMQVCSLVSAGGILICIGGTWWAIVLCALVVGAGYGPAGPGSSAVLAAHTPAHARGFIFSIKQTGVPIGGAIAGAILPGIALAYDWRAAIVVCAGLLVLSAVLIEFVRAPIDKPILTDVRPKLRDILRVRALLSGVVAHPELPRVVYSGFSAAMMQGSVFALLVTFLVAKGGLDLVSAGLAFAAMNLSGTASRPLMGLASDKIVSAQALIALLGAVATVAVTAMIWSGDRLPFIAVVGLAVVMGATVSGWNGVLIAEIARLAPAGSVSQVTAASMVYVYIGYTIGPLLTAMLVGWTGNYALAFLPVSLALIGAIVGHGLHAARRKPAAP